ncbi:MAG: bifunctional isocitrate dehydrogenase kinase/phosphatase [Deltaproteobacteria bacterium]|nr:bifunctional isocitrate dehydrogenase kinase/phosphatase [Deltaproteobacteria bacterium]
MPVVPDSSDAAAAVRDAFLANRETFLAITRRARRTFETRDWAAAAADAGERLNAYRDWVDHVEGEVRRILGGAIHDRRAWHRMRARFAALVAGRGDVEIAETFFNSVTRRVFSTVGVDPDIEFLDPSEPGPPDSVPECRLRGGGCLAGCETACACASYPLDEGSTTALRSLLLDLSLSVAWEDIDRDASAGAAVLDHDIEATGPPPPRAIEVLRPLFFRNKGAYVVGRVRSGRRITPLLLAILNGPRGLRLDAVLTTRDEASVVFSFTRSYFHVAVDNPREAVGFLRTLMPAKPIGELYASIGEHKHGKTVLYRHLQRHLSATEDRLVAAPGSPGLVMVVFGPASLDVVFKVIRDRPTRPKDTNRREVMERYRLVFRSDRVGRLVDATEFEHMAFERARFAPGLLDELLRDSGEVVAAGPDLIDVRHMYAERRVTPLDLYLSSAPAGHAVRVVQDYGQAIKDLAAADIFPGDLLLKNFGVTRHGRVVSYDYDELWPLTKCNFRGLPAPRDDVEEAADEPFFYVGPHDVFPEEHARFLGLPPRLRDAFMDLHADLFGTAYWTGMQERLRSGDLPDVFPYPAERRLQPSRVLGPER